MKRLDSDHQIKAHSICLSPQTDYWPRVCTYMHVQTGGYNEVPLCIIDVLPRPPTCCQVGWLMHALVWSGLVGGLPEGLEKAGVQDDS